MSLFTPCGLVASGSREVVHEVNVFEFRIAFAFAVVVEDGLEHVCEQLVSYEAPKVAVTVY